MARQVLVPQQSLKGGVDITWVAAHVDGFSMTNAQTLNTYILVKNSGNVAMDVTIDTVAQLEGLAVADIVFEVGAADITILGPFSINFHQAGASNIFFNTELTTDIFVAAFKK